MLIFFYRGESCYFGNTLSPDVAEGSNNYLRFVTEDRNARFNNIDELYQRFCSNDDYNNKEIYGRLCGTRNPYFNGSSSDRYEPASNEFFAPRTCNQYWNPTVTVSETNVDSFYLGMASQRAEREDFIITPDLRGQVFGALDFTRRDLMAQNLQRARDHGLPDFNSARVAYGLEPVYSFEDLNPMYGMDNMTTANIERLRDVYSNDISK